jgi:adenylate cyclase
LVVAWGHAMIGLHFWLRVRPWYARLQPTALVVAVLVPVLSLLGAIEAGRQVTALAADPNWIHERITLPSPETQSTLDTITALLSWFFAGIVGAVLLARLARRIWQRHHGLVRIGYPDGRVVEVTPGTSVLEASRLAGIPHASVCGAAAAARLAAFGCAARSTALIPLPRTSCAYSAASVQRLVSASPASCGHTARLR